MNNSNRSTLPTRSPPACLAVEFGLGLDLDQSAQMGVRLDLAGHDLRNVCPGATERITDDQQLVRAVDRLIKGLGQRAALGVADLNGRHGKLVLDGERFGPPLAPAAPKRRNSLSGVCHGRVGQHAALTGQMLANGPGQNRAAACAPFEIRGPDHRAWTSGWAAGSTPCSTTALTPSFCKSATAAANASWRRTSRTVGVLHVINRALGLGAVGAGGTSQILDHLGHGIAAAAGDGQHGRKQIATPAGIEQLAVRSPAIPAVKAMDRRLGRPIGRGACTDCCADRSISDCGATPAATERSAN